MRRGSDIGGEEQVDGLGVELNLKNRTHRGFSVGQLSSSVFEREEGEKKDAAIEEERKEVAVTKVGGGEVLEGKYGGDYDAKVAGGGEGGFMATVAAAATIIAEHASLDLKKRRDLVITGRGP